MKRHSNLFEQICDIENLRLAFKRASRHKHRQRKIKNVEKDLENKLLALQQDLLSGEYKTSAYKTKKIYEPKERIIYILPFYPDRIVHHAIMNVLEPIWNNLMYYHSYACRKNKGQHAGSRKCMEYVRKYRYCLQCDVSKFYPNVNHAILKEILRKKIKDKRLLLLLDEIIDSAEGDKNVPIGNYLSQWFGNLYLNELDERVKHVYKIKPYLRYCDDFVFFGNDKAELNKIKADISKWMYSRLKLKLSKCSLYPTSQGVDFLGYRHFPNKILVRKRTAKRVKKNVRGLIYKIRHKEITPEQALSTIASHEGWIKHAQTYNLRKFLHLEELKQEVLAIVGTKALQRLC